MGAKNIRTSTTDGPDRGQRRDPACGHRALNIVYHVIRKPTELFVLVGNALDKEPTENWWQYGPLFRVYSTLEPVWV